jgi:hypothetical protein
MVANEKQEILSGERDGLARLINEGIAARITVISIPLLTGDNVVEYLERYLNGLDGVTVVGKKRYPNGLYGCRTILYSEQPDGIFNCTACIEYDGHLCAGYFSVSLIGVVTMYRVLMWKLGA